MIFCTLLVWITSSWNRKKGFQTQVIL